MIDNYKHILPLLDFSDPDKYYFIQVLQRKKDHKERKVSGTNNNSRMIKAYYVSNLEYFEFVYPEMIELAKVFGARVMINLNRRSYRTSAFKMLSKLAEICEKNEQDKVYKAYSSVAGTYQSEKNKVWLLDIDDTTIEEYPLDEQMKLDNTLHELQPVGDKIVKIIPSNSGIHIITKPFNKQKFGQLGHFPYIELKVKPLTNLYIP